jgi:hypothetical protein
LKKRKLSIETKHHIPEHLNPQQQCCKNLKLPHNNHRKPSNKLFCVALLNITSILTYSFSPHVPEVFPVDWKMMVQTVVTIKIYWHFGACERKADRQTKTEKTLNAFVQPSCACMVVPI